MQGKRKHPTQFDFRIFGRWRGVVLGSLLLAISAVVRAQFTTSTNAGSVTITGYTGSGGSVIIPAMTNGLPIVAIGPSAFYDTAVSSVAIGTNVTTIGASAFSYCFSLASINIPNSVVSIGADAFFECSALLSVAIPNSVISIGDDAFAYCDGLTNTITLGSSVTTIGNSAFYNCSMMTGVILPNSVVSIGDDAFESCGSLTNTITLGSSVTNIGVDAFANCSSIPGFTVSAGNAWYSSTNGVLFDKAQDTLIQATAAISGAYTIPNSVINIGEDAFYECYVLTSVTIPNSVANISQGAFFDCSSLSSVAIPNSVTNIDADAFSGGSSLTNVTLGSVLINIGEDAFEDSAITSLVIPNSVTNIGDFAFCFCPALATVTIGSAVTSIGNYLFYYCQSLTNVTLVSSVNKIETYAFCDCTALKNITIPNSVTNIGSYAFQDCTALTNITLGSSLVGIGTYAFEFCSALKNIAIPDSVTSIGADGFYDCSSLTNASIGGGVTNIGTQAFSGCTKLSAFAVNPANLWYSSLNGTLYNQPQTVLIECPPGASGTLTIPSTCTNIAADACYQCASLGSIVIPPSVVGISTYACYGCSSLTNLSIGSGVTSIGTYAFNGCTKLSGVTIPNSVSLVGADAFYGCSKLVNVTVGVGVTNIGASAFQSCTVLTNIYFSGNAPSLGNTNIFVGDANTTVYYQSGTTGWGATFAGRPTALWSMGSFFSYSRTVFNESTNDDGTINNVTPLIVTLAGGGSFNGTIGQEFVSSGWLAVSNLPSGLTVVATETSTNTLSVTITGQVIGATAASSVNNLTFVFQNAAVAGGNVTNIVNYAANNLQVVFVTPVYPALNYSGLVFLESAANNGSMGNSITVSLANTTFTGNNGDDFVAGGKVLVSNVPAGLTATIIRQGVQTLTASLTGTATAHYTANNVTNLIFAFQNSAFQNNNAAAVTNTVMSNLQIQYLNPALTYASTTFIESASGDGSITNIIAISLAGDTFNGTVGENLVASGKLQISNVPAGLTAVATVQIGSTLSLALTGNATSLTPANDVTNLTLAFQNSAFLCGNATIVTNATVSNLQVQFFSPALTYASSMFVESAAEDGSITNTIAVSLTGDSFNGSTGENFVQTAKVVPSNVPIGLTAVVTLQGSSTLLIALTGNAVAHAPANNVTNLTFAFQNTAFLGNNAAVVTNAVMSNLQIQYLNPALTYASTTFMESTLENGSITNTLSVSLAGDVFNGTTAENFVLSGKVIPSNVPTGLTAVVTMQSGSTLSVALIGSAVAHAPANDVTNLTLAFQNSAFQGNNAAIVTNAMVSNLQILYLTPILTYAPKTFYESWLNDGSISNTIQATLIGDVFNGTLGENFIATGKVAPMNLPTGLTAQVTMTATQTLTVALLGNAANGAGLQSITNLGFAFANTAFGSGQATNVTNYNESDLSILFLSQTVSNWYVSTSGVDSSASSGSTSQPFRTVGYALTRVQSTANDVIHLLPGNYTESNLTIAANLTITGDTAADTILQACSAPFTGQNLQLLNVQANLIVSNLTLRYANAGTNGAAIACTQPNAIITINGCCLTQNASTNGSGGAIGWIGAGAGNGQLTLLNTVISSNQAASGGGGIADNLAALNINNCTFTANSAGPGTSGGSISMGAALPLAIGFSSFTSNSAGNGGGVFAANAGGVAIFNSTFAFNIATNAGGGFQDSQTTATIVNSTFYGNTATTGGAISGITTGGATLGIYNSTVFSNRATVAGGGIYEATPLILTSTIVAGNTAPTGPDLDHADTNTPVDSYSFVGNNVNSALIAGQTNQNGSYIGSATNILNPGLLALTNNGGVTMTCAEQNGSLAIDHGTNTLGLLTDQRGTGYARQYGSGVDIGAYEYGAYLTYYWNGPNSTAWNATNNSSTNLTWWHLGSTNGAFSPTLPGNLAICYDLVTNWMRTTVDLGTTGQYATVHMGNGSLWGGSTSTGDNPVVVDSGNATLCAASGGGQTWNGAITINGNSLTLLNGGGLSLYGPISGAGQLICTNKNPGYTFSFYNWANTYSGGTILASGVQVTMANQNMTGGGWAGSDGEFGTGPVDMSNGSSVKQADASSSATFSNTLSSFYGSSGGSNTLTTSGCNWLIGGGGVIWRPGARNRSGVGVTKVSGMPILLCSSDANGNVPTLQMGMHLGGVCDRLLLSTNSTGYAPVFQPKGCLKLYPDNLETNRSPAGWLAQTNTLYTVVQQPWATNATVGGFSNPQQPVAGQSCQQIFFDPTNYFQSAYISYQGNAAAGTTTGGNDVVLWNFNPAPTTPTLVYSGTAFYESASINGTINNTAPLTITLYTGTLSGANGDDFAALGRVVVGNLPSGLTVSIIRINPNKLVVTLNGTAIQNNAANSVSNLLFAFQNSAFSGTAASGVSNAVSSNLSITFANPLLQYSGTVFTGSSANNGSIVNSLMLTLLSSGMSFGGINGEDLVAAGLVSVSNVPAGLTPVVVRTSSTTATLSLTGCAQLSGPAYNVTNLTVAFSDNAFVGGPAALVTASTCSNLAVNFYAASPFQVGITVKECAGVGTTNYPICVVVPLPRGAYQNPGVFNLVDSLTGSNVPCQVQVLNRWWVPDNSLRHIEVIFQPSVTPFTGMAGTGTHLYYLYDNGAPNLPPSSPVQVTTGSNGYTVVTGPLQFTVPTNTFTLLGQVWFNPTGNGVFTTNNLVVSSALTSGGVFTPWSGGGPVQYDSASTGVTYTVEESGPIRTVIRADSATSFTSTNLITHGWAVRIYAYAGLPYIKIDYQLQNSAKNTVWSWPLYFTSMNLNIPLLLGSNPNVTIGLGNGSVYSRGLNTGLCLRQTFHNQFQIYDNGAGSNVYNSGTITTNAAGLGADGFIDVTDASRGVCAATRYFWQMWPNGLQVDASNNLSVQLFPSWSCQWEGSFATNLPFATNGLYWLDDMQHTYKESMLYFHDTTATPSNLVSVARTFAFPPVGTLPMSWRTTAAASLDLDGVLPSTNTIVVSAGDQRMPIYTATGSPFSATDMTAYCFGWDSFDLGPDVQRKTHTDETGGWAYSAGAFEITGNPSDYYFAEMFSMSELNVRPEWMSHYSHSNDWNFLQLQSDPYGSQSWRFYAGNTPAYVANGGKLAAPYLPGTSQNAYPRDDEHSWFYHNEEAYYYTANPWVRDWYQFIGEYRKTRLNQQDHTPDMSSRATAHSLSHAMQAYRVTGDTTIPVLYHAYVTNYLRPVQIAERDGSRSSLWPAPGGDGEAAFQMGYLARSMLGYMEEVKGWDTQGYNDCFQYVAGIMAWNLNYSHYAYYIDARTNQVDTVTNGASSGSSVPLDDAQDWFYWHTGLTPYWQESCQYVNAGISGTTTNGVGLTNEFGGVSYATTYENAWPYDNTVVNWVGRYHSYILNMGRGSTNPPPGIVDLRAWTNAVGMNLSWTAPASAVRYYVVCSTQQIVWGQTQDSTVCNWWAANAISCTMTAKPAGQIEAFIFQPPATNCYTAVFAFDAYDNMSPMSNLAQPGSPPLTPTPSLTINSAFGGALPGGGIATNYGMMVSAWITNSIAINGRTQYVCTGATVANNTFTQIAATSVALTLTNNATLTWLWQPQAYFLTLGTNGQGIVSSTPATGWCATGTVVSLTAVPATYWAFSGWQGDITGSVFAGTSATTTMSQARSIMGDFSAILAANQTPLWWLAQYGLPTNNAGALASSATPGMANWQKYIAELNPTNPASVLQIVGFSTNGVTFTPAANDRIYAVTCTTNLLTPNWQVQGSFQSGTGGSMFLPLTNQTPHAFYRVRVQLSP